MRIVICACFCLMVTIPAHGYVVEVQTAPSENVLQVIAPRKKEKPDQPARPRHKHRKKHRLRFIEQTIVLPSGFEPVVALGETFYYNKGVFFQLVGDALVEVEAPLGAVVKSLPTTRKRVEVGGVYYNYYNDTYFELTIDGYRVVRPYDRP